MNALLAPAIRFRGLPSRALEVAFDLLGEVRASKVSPNPLDNLSSILNLCADILYGEIRIMDVCLDSLNSLVRILNPSLDALHGITRAIPYCF